MKRFILLILIFSTFSKSGLCCSCVGKGQVTVEDFNSYNVIFIGKLIQQLRGNISDYSLRRKCIYKITKAYKGAVTDDTVSIFDAEDPGACGLGTMTVGGDYLIYAFGDEKMITTSCSRTTKVPNLSWPQDSLTINKLINMNSFGRLYDTVRTNFIADTLFLNKHITKIYNNSSIQKFFNKDGSLCAEGRYIDGRPEGYWKYLKKTGVAQGKYINGEKDSLWTEPYSKEMVYIREYRSGKFTFKETLFYDGKISSKQEPTDKDGKWIVYDFHPNGKMRFKAYANPPKRASNGNLERPIWDGPFNMFNNAGVLLQTGIHKDGLSVGLWKYFYNDGKLRMEGSYTGGKKHGQWRIYYPNKRIKAIGIYKHDKKTETWRYFNENSKEISPDPELIKEDEDWYTYSG